MPGRHLFTDVQRWRWYNTDNIWIGLRALRSLQAADPAVAALPLVVNREAAGPRDLASTLVIRLEWAMGAAIGTSPSARVVRVPPSRLVPVKTTDDLLVVRSGGCELASGGRIRPSFDGPRPVVTLAKGPCGLLPASSSGLLPGCRRCAAAAGSRSKATSPSARASWPWARCVWPVRVGFHAGRYLADDNATAAWGSRQAPAGRALPMPACADVLDPW